MIKVTTLDGCERYLNSDLIEMITEIPETHIALLNGNRYLVQEPAIEVIDRIICFRKSLHPFHWIER
jgi:flagellar protein FlbD